MTTISEFIGSTALEEIIVFNCPKYREKFSKIVGKTGVGDYEIEGFSTIDGRSHRQPPNEFWDTLTQNLGLGIGQVSFLILIGQSIGRKN